jgi:Histidine kinase
MPNEPTRPSTRVRDLRARLLLSPVLGVLVPAVSGLVDPRRHSWLGLALSYVAFAGVAFLIWEGNRRLHARLSRREDWLRRPWHRAGLLFAAILLFTIPASTTMLVAWQRVTGDPGLRPYAVPTAVLAIVAIVAAITHVYETVFLLKDWEGARLRSARAESARLSAELDRLTRESDPHFLFNNLHALQHLVERGDPQAGPFIEALSETYRYVLAARRGQLVPLDEELRALERHRLLAATRYAGGVEVAVELPAEVCGRLLLPPASLGELLLNALKHNDVSAGSPLVLRVSLEADSLVIANVLRPRARRSASTGVGLRNLAERVRLSAGRPMRWGPEGDRFVVRLPLTNAADAGAPDTTA